MKLGLVFFSFLLVNGKSVYKRQAIIFGFDEPKNEFDCKTPSGTDGICTKLFDCKPFSDRFKSGGGGDQEFIALLRKSICRFINNIPVVCCPVVAGPGFTTTKVPITERSSPPTPSTTPSPPTTPPSESDLLPRACGKVSGTALRIVGGRVAKKGSWPWLAALGYKSLRGKLDFLCGGALITTQHILTAAHCVHGRSDLSVIRLGEHDLRNDSEVEQVDFNIKKRVEHENYDTTNFANDIAILTLDRPATFTDFVSPVCLPTGSFFINNSLDKLQAFVAGWGSIAYNNISSPVLKEAILPIRSNDECKTSYAIFRSIVIDQTRLCAGEGGNDACQGDSGGPLMVFDGQNGRFATAGVVSVGFRCAEPKFPGVYTRVTEFLGWIEKNLKQ